MNITNFLNLNYVNILLLISLVVSIVLTKSFNKFQSTVLLFLTFVSIITLVLTFIESDLSNLVLKDTVHKYIYIFIFIIQPIEILLLILSFNKIKSKHIILLSLPAFINLVLMLSLSFTNIIINVNDGIIIKGFLFYLELFICIFYFLLLIINGIYLFTKKKIADSIIILSVSAINVFALIYGAYNLTFSLSNTSIVIGAIIFFINNYIKYQSTFSANQEKTIQEQKTSLTISQIQPHFLYNALATIGYLCKEDPIKASKALDEFSDYLRANLNAINQKNNVPFLEELKHVKTYVWLEQLRFEDRLKVVYDIQFTDFVVPALSLQPLVENAIKHGICEKVKGGTLTIRTIEYNEYVKVVIEDDGIGFMPNETFNDGKSHIGIENVKSRLKSMSNATLEIQSVVGKGTIVVITFPRS